MGPAQVPGRWIPWLVALSLCGCEGAKKESEAKKPEAVSVDTALAGIISSGDSIENEPYQFRLGKPGPEWDLLEGNEARQISADAQAAAVFPSGLTAVVIVEHAPNMTLEKMGDLLLDSMPIESKRIEERETIDYVGLKAVRYLLSGNVNEIPMDYSGRIFMRDKYAYQVVVFAPRGVASPKELDAIFETFELLDGEIRPIQEDMTSPDMVGVGWRLKGGVFESAISGLRVEPKGGWRAVVGAEARRMNVDAEVVLIHQAPEAYFLLIPELIGNASPKVYLQDRIDTTAANMKGSVDRKTIDSTLLGKPVKSTILSGGEVPWTFQVAVAFEKEWAVQATGWYTGALGEEGQKAIAGAMASVSRMPSQETSALRKELLALPDEQDDVGKNFSLRSGIFRDYEHGVQWTKPEGFWELSVGQEARAINPIAQLYGRYSNSALHVLLVAERASVGLDAKTYHRQAFQGAQNNLSLKAEKVGSSSRIGSGAALQTDATTNLGGIDLGYRVITSMEGNTGVQLHIWGVASGMERHASALKAAADSLLLRKLPPSEVRKGVYYDHRLGFSMRLANKYPHTDETPAELIGIGSFPTWGVDGADWAGVLAVCAIEAGRDREWSMNLMEERIRESYDNLIKTGKASKEETTLLGLQARHLIWKTPALRLDAYLIRRNHTIYAILATDISGGTGMIDKATAGFQLID